MLRVSVVKAAAAVVAFLGGCGTELPPQSLVDGFRILAVRSDPPHAAPGERVRVEALIADPGGGGRSVVRAWIACLPGPGGDMDRCRDPGGGAIVAFGAGEVLEFDAPDAGSGDGPAVAIVTLAACAGGVLSMPPGGEGPSGLPACEGGDGAVAIKRVFVGGDAPPNRNPVVESLEIDGEPLVDADPSLRLPPCEAGSCPRRTVRLRYAEGSSERFVVVEFGTPRERTEDLYMSWFATAGEFARIRSGGMEPEVEWVQPEGVGAVVFYFVGHDGRGGQDWATRRVVIE